MTTTRAGDEVPDGAIIITPKEFYDGVRKDIADIGTVMAAIDKKLDPIPEAVRQMQARVSTLEQRVWYITGVSAGAAALFGALASFLH